MHICSGGRARGGRVCLRTCHFIVNHSVGLCAQVVSSDKLRFVFVLTLYFTYYEQILVTRFNVVLKPKNVITEQLVVRRHFRHY